MISNKVEIWKQGIHNVVRSDIIPEGAASDALGWLTKGDQIELSRGKLLIGTNVAGGGKIRGLAVFKRIDGTEVWFEKHETKIRYYIPNVSSDWADTGISGLDADHDYTFTPHNSLAGIFVYVGGLGGFWKIHLANPGSAVSQYDAAKNYKAKLRIDKSRMFAWAMANDKTGLYISHIDEENYTTVSNENVGTGNGVQVTFTDTLVAITGKRTGFAIEVTDGVETFTDDRNGLLTGSLGGTGTINYATGAISVTFNTAPGGAVAILCDYQWEDATDGGVADFTYSATRVAGEGDVFRQDEGGSEILNLLIDNGAYYSIKDQVIYELTLTADDTNATNHVIRRNIGISSWRACTETSLGIVLLDTSNVPNLVRLERNLTGDDLIPNNLADQFDFDAYDWDEGWLETWGHFIVVGTKTRGADNNDRLLLWDARWKSIDAVPFNTQCAAKTGGGLLLVGDSLSDNVFEAFSGTDDDGFPIQPNYFIGRADLLGYEGLKKSKKMFMEGLIGQEQTINVYARYDENSWELIAVIEGTGAYVDTSDSNTIGSAMIGEDTIGGEGDGITAYKYHYPFRVRPPKFYRRELKFEATGIGWASVMVVKDEDLQQKLEKVPLQYRQYRGDAI